MVKILKRKNVARGMHKMNFIKLKKCPYCKNESFDTLTNTSVNFIWKGICNSFIPEFKSSYDYLVHCKECDCIFKHTIPTIDFLNKIYSSEYVDQPAGLTRFKSLFIKNVFDSSVLEVGGGRVGIREICNADYYNLDPNSKYIPEQITGWNIEKLNFDDLDYLKTIRVQNIVACDVIEHLSEPSKLFELASFVLPVSGKLFLHVGQSHLNTVEHIQIQTLHLSSASKNTIKFMAKKYGFKIMNEQTKHETAFVLKRIS